MTKLQRVDEMQEPPVVGRTYLVPTVVHPFTEYGARAWPVMGTMHQDAEFLNFPHHHYHLDWRFLPRYAFKAALRRAATEQRIFGLPLCARDQPFGEVIHRRRKCLRLMPINNIFSEVVGGRDLHKAWFGKPATRGLHGFICPHRGTPLGSAVVAEDGTITCPLHGLKFCAKTGASVATHDMGTRA